MTVGEKGQISFGAKSLIQMVIAGFLGSGFSVFTGMVVMYGDKRVMEEKVGVLEKTDERHSSEIKDLDSRMMPASNSLPIRRCSASRPSVTS
jgi:hypothetical protein